MEFLEVLDGVGEESGRHHHEQAAHDREEAPEVEAQADPEHGVAHRECDRKADDRTDHELSGELW